MGNLWRAKDRYGNLLAEYTYDAFGRRVKKRIVSGGQNVKEIAYHYVGYSLSVAKETERLWETDHWGAWRIRRVYLLNGRLAAHIVGVRHYDYSGGGAPVVSLYQYIYDPSGNVAAVLNEDGQMVYVDKNGIIGTVSTADNVACRFEYDAYGNNIYRSDDWNKQTAMKKAWETFPHHISTKEWDPEANLYYFGHRWYEPRQGAYVSRTPLSPLDEESYSYCHNDPINFFDPNGLDAEEVHGVWYYFFVDLDDYTLAAAEGIQSSVMFGYYFHLTDPNRHDLDVTRLWSERCMDVATFVKSIGKKGAEGLGKGLLGITATEGFIKYHKYHIFPRQFKDWFLEKGININKFVVPIEEKAHLCGVHGNGLGEMPGKWNDRWDEFIRSSTSKTTRNDIIKLLMIFHRNLDLM